MKIENTGVQLTEKDIHKFEKELHIKLPQDYKKFMLETNGGEPEDNWVFDFFDIANERNDSSVMRYFSILYTAGNRNTHDIKADYEALVETEQIPKKYLPIAQDPYGNIIFLCLAKEDNGKVFFGDHELEDIETGYLAMSHIADSFSAFLAMLHE